MNLSKGIMAKMSAMNSNIQYSKAMKESSLSLESNNVSENRGYLVLVGTIVTNRTDMTRRKVQSTMKRKNVGESVESKLVLKGMYLG